MAGGPRRGKTAVVVLGSVLAGCRPAPTVCASEGGCVAPSSSAAPSPLSQTRRLLYDPVAVGYVRRHAGPEGTPALATLGSGDGALLLLRFSIDLPPEPHIVAAFVLLERATNVDDEPRAIDLRAARVTQAWDSRWVSWALQPRLDELGEPLTRVEPAAGSLVRVEVRKLVRRWLRRGRDEFGIAVEADAPRRAGMTFALAPGPGSSEGDGPAAYQGPRLELYVK
jgi:hypothetical protein